MLTIKNNHIAECGTPNFPDIDKADYVACFENRYGEQWVIWHLPDQPFLHLRSGDCGWDRAFVIWPKGAEDPSELSNYAIKGSDDGDGIVHSREEMAFITACVTACRSRLKLEEEAQLKTKENT